jgi:hypothetical protein
MKYQNFVQSMLPNLEKSQVKEELRLLREELVNITTPAYKQAAPAFKRQAFTAKFTKEIDQLASTRVNEYKENYVETTLKALEMAVEATDTLDRLVEDRFASDVVKAAMDYNKTSILQYAEMLTFLSRYARRLLIMTYTLETNPNVEALSKGNSRDLGWLHKHKDAYMVCLNAALTRAKEVETKLEEVPEILVKEENRDVAVKTVGLAKLDPFGVGIIPTFLNPIYHIRMSWTRYQVSRYKLAKEELEQLELRLMLLKDSRSGKKDAKLEQSIEYNEERVEKLRYKVYRMEETDD